jgi:hypothetical protein
MRINENMVDYLVENKRVTATKQLFAIMWTVIESRGTIEVTRTINGIGQTMQIKDGEELADYKLRKIPLEMVLLW